MNNDLQKHLGSQRVERIEANESLVEQTRLIATWIYQKPPNTQKAYKREIRRLFSYYENCDLKALRTDHVGEYLSQLSHLKPSSRKRARDCISSLYTFLVRANYVQFNPVLALEPEAVPDTTSSRVLSIDEIRRMIDLEATSRNRVLLKLLFKTGIRIGEVQKLQFNHIYERNDKIFMTVIGKGQKVRTILLDANIHSEIMSLRVIDEAIELAKDHAVFYTLYPPHRALSSTQLWRVVKAAAKRAKISNACSPHWLRHSHATYALEKGIDIREIQQTLGHESIATTTKYTQVSPTRSSSRIIDI